MSAVDPYRAPRNELLTDEMQEVGEIRFFSPSCRIGRLRYVAHGSLFYIGFAVVVGIIMGAVVGMFPVFGGMMASAGVAVLYIPFFVIYWVLIVQRLHDLDLLGWWSLLLFVPVINLFFLLYILLWPGTQGVNRFGPKPPANKTWHWVVGLTFPAVMLVGILAAIMLPAYQDYADRARQAQESR